MLNLDDKQSIKNSLLRIASVLNKNNIKWGLGGSLLLYLYGINTTVADIDIVIDIDDMKKVEGIVKNYTHIEKEKSGIYLTERFYSININKVDIDLMIGFKVLTTNGTYSYPIGDKIIDKSIIIDGAVIYLCSLKDWLEAYTAMGRTNKIELINQSKLVK
jgi:hypothetical protein